MISHYLSSALAQVRRTPFTSLASIFTLALGLACFVAAYGIATYWASGDTHHPGAERLVYVCAGCAGGRPGEVESPLRLAAELRRDIADLEVAGRIAPAFEVPVAAGANKAFLEVVGADPEIFDLFAFTFVEGQRQAALRGPDDVVLTEETAKRLFGNAPALGRTLVIDGQRELTVAGVIALGPHPTFLGQEPVRFDVLTNLTNELSHRFAALGMPLAMADNWNFHGVTTFARLPSSMSIETFQARVDAFAERVLPKRGDGRPEFRLTVHPIGNITTSIVDGRFTGEADLGMSTGTVLMGLGALILLVACVNYSNLTAAQAAARIKEVGMRKVLGADRRQLLMQHVVEAGVLTIPALGLALLFVALAAPVFRNALDVDVTYFLIAGPRGALFLAAVFGAVAVAVALWPTVILARARSVDALGLGRTRMGTGGLVSRIFVGVQFMSASFLIIVVAVGLLQHAHMRNAVFDAEADPVVLLNNLTKTGISPGTLQAELSAVPQVRGFTALQYEPWTGRSIARYIGRSGEKGSPGFRVMVKGAGTRYFEVFGLEVLAGRVFDPERDGSGAGLLAHRMSARGDTSPEAASVVIDRRFAEELGFHDAQQALGQTLYEPPHPQDPRALPGPGPAIGTILGVVETEHSRLGTGYSGSMFVFDPAFEQAQTPAVRIDRADVPGALKEISRVWEKVAPNLPLRTQFSDELFERAYAPFHAITATFLSLSIAALVISTTGVLAVAVHVAARRRSEIGVRKTLGASTGRVLSMLLADFSAPVLIGNLVAWPLAWGAAQLFFQPFAERVTLTPLPFVASLAITLAIAWLAVGGQVWKAARVQPALVLRAE
jgi:putative ABC transport system permease protein